MSIRWMTLSAARIRTAGSWAAEIGNDPPTRVTSLAEGCGQAGVGTGRQTPRDWGRGGALRKASTSRDSRV